MPGPRDYTQTTRTALAALSQGRCYFPGCDRPIVAFRASEPFVDCQIAHIRDARPGNRFDPHMKDDERRAFANLILLCKPCHDLVDRRHPRRYSVADLARWKQEREDGALSGLSGVVTDADLEEAIVETVALAQATEGAIQAGGYGGAAPGAGGGGGGVVGSGRGGDGGAGGDITIGDEVEINLAGTPGLAPGAGGGGGGVIEDGTFAPPPRTTREGLGFSDGTDGADGGETRFGNHVVAPGAKGGLAGTGLRCTTKSLGVSALLLANYVELSGGLATLLVIEAGGVDAAEYTITLTAISPSGTRVASVSFPVTVEKAADVVRILRWQMLDVQIDESGTWRLVTEHDGCQLSAIGVFVKRTGETE